MRNSCSWTFWKGESKIYNFHFGQNFIWSIFGHVILRRKPFHFWQFWITSHFLFLESFHLTLFSSFLMFEMSNETCLDMNEVSLTLSHLQIHHFRHSWPQLTFLTDRWIWLCTDQVELQTPDEMAPQWNPSFHKLNETIWWSLISLKTSSPWQALIGTMQMIRVDQRSKP
jgi:hypothetical protein